MKIREHHLATLLKAASSAARPASAPLTSAQAHRILAQWRALRTGEETFDWRRVFRFGLACACVCLLLAAAFSLRDTSPEPVSEFQLPAQVMNLAFK